MHAIDYMVHCSLHLGSAESTQYTYTETHLGYVPGADPPSTSFPRLFSAGNEVGSTIGSDPMAWHCLPLSSSPS